MNLNGQVQTGTHRLIGPRAVHRALDQVLVGQDEAKRQLSVVISRHFAAPATGALTWPAQHCLLHGPSGCGKTTAMRAIARHLHVPVLIEDATRLVSTGYQGRHVSEMVESLYLQCRDERGIVSRGILFLDEIDKLATNEGHISTTGAQQELLTLLDGQVMCLRMTGADKEVREVRVDTSQFLVIGGGAFAGLEQITSHRMGSHFGFGPGRADDGDSRPTSEDFIEYGMMLELVGRFRQVIGMEPLAGATLVKLAWQACRPIIHFARLFGVEVRFTQPAIDALVGKAALRGLGARGLEQAVNEATGPTLAKIEQLSTGGIGQIVIGEGVVLGGSPPRYVRRPARKTMVDDDLYLTE